MSSDDPPLEIIQKTQKILGKYVKKPILSDKLLKKPPFRFLHDVINAVIKETGFLKGLFNEMEMNSASFTEKDIKIAFLNKLIDAVKTITQTDLKVKANKIVAGLEPTETNLLLQAIGRAVDKKTDSSEYVKKLKKSTGNEKKKVKTEEKVKRSNTKTSLKSKDVKESKTKLTVKKAETPKSSDRSSTKETKIKTTSSKDVKEKSSKDKTKLKKTDKSPRENKTTPKTSPRDIVKIDEPEVQPVAIEPEIKTEEPNNEQLTNDDTTVNEQPSEEKEEPVPVVVNRVLSARPKSARPKSGDRNKFPVKKNDSLEDNTDKPLEMKSTSSQPIVNRPKSSLRPPSVRPSSARPGAPRLRPDSALPVHEPITMGTINVIVENVDNADDEETVVIHNTSEIVEETTLPSLQDLNIPLENKGHLVEQILGQIQDGEVDDIKSKVEIDWEQDGLNQSTTMKEVSHLRSLIQSLTKTANPLGKLMNYLHEDIEAMHNELQMWVNTKKQLFMEIDKQKRMSAESDKPLLVHLEQLQQEIRKQEQEIAIVRSNILKNEFRINELLTK